jgi:hypothetical protein
MARKTNLTLLVSPEERQTLESWQRSTTIRAGLANSCFTNFRLLF